MTDDTVRFSSHIYRLRAMALPTPCPSVQVSQWICVISRLDVMTIYKESDCGSTKVALKYLYPDF